MGDRERHEGNLNGRKRRRIPSRDQAQQGIGIALKGTPFEGIDGLFTGPTAIAFSRDPVAAAKVAVAFAKANEKLQIVGAGLGSQVLNVEGVKALATLPSLDQLRAQFIGLLKTPATRIAGVLQAPGGQLARVLSAYANKDEAA